MTEIDLLKAEIVMLTNRDETPGLRYFEFFSNAMGFDVAAGVKIDADHADDTGPFWSIEIHEIWAGIYNVTAFLHPDVLAAVTAEAHAHIGPDLNTADAIRSAAIQARSLRAF